MKKGTAVVTAKIKAGKKIYTKNVKITVTAPKTSTKTNAPLKTEKPTVTETPVVDNTAKPPVTDVPTVDNTIPPATDVPDVNNTPTPGTDATAVPDITAAPTTTAEPTAEPTATAESTVVPTATAAPTATPEPQITSEPLFSRAPQITSNPDTTSAPTAVPDTTATPSPAPTAQDMSISLTVDNVQSLKSSTTLSVENETAKLTGISGYDDGFAITFDIPEGTKLQDYESVKLSVKASNAIYGSIVVGINKENPSEPKNDGNGNYHPLWAYSSDPLGKLDEPITTEKEKYTVSLDFSSYTQDITGTICLIIGIAGNNTNDVELSDLSLNIPRVKTPVTLTDTNTTPLHKASTCTITEDGKAQLTCTGNSDAIVVKYNIEAGKSLQDYKGISITFKSEKNGVAYGKEIMAALNEWDVTKPNFDSNTDDNWDLGSQKAIAKIKRNIKNDTEISYILDFDFSTWSKGDITGEIALIIGVKISKRQPLLVLLITDRAEVSIISGTKLTADTVVLQWKKAKADLTEYDTP